MGSKEHGASTLIAYALSMGYRVERKTTNGQHIRVCHPKTGAIVTLPLRLYGQGRAETKFKARIERGARDSQ